MVRQNGSSCNKTICENWEWADIENIWNTAAQPTVKHNSEEDKNSRKK